MAGYGDDSGFTAWLSGQGYSLPAGGPTAAVLRQRGSTYVDGTYGNRFPGSPIGGVEQERAWPRTGAEDRFGNVIGSTTIPTRVIEASYFAAYQEASSAGSLVAAVTANRQIRRQKVEGAVEREFFAAGTGLSAVEASTPIFTAIEGLLAPLLVVENLPGILVV